MSEPNDRLETILRERYRLERELGRGAMGVVYRAYDTRLDRPVAIKFLSPDAGSGESDEALEPRFVGEARAVSALDHPNLGAVYEIERSEDGRLFIVMAYHEGETLKARIARGPLLIDDAADIASQLAAGLGAAHRPGVVHRDIKPSNVIITGSGVVKIIDFGIAKTATAGDLTRTGQTLGTVDYMSPEQARGEAVDARSDLWSLGAIMYEMLTGRPPFSGANALATLHSILNAPPDPVTNVRPEAPPAFVEIIDRCLAKRPDDRPGSADEVAAALARVRDDGARVAGVSEGRPRAGPAAALMGGLALAVIAAAFAFFGRGDSSPVDSIAVIPFENLSGDAEREYFVGGMQEALINSLSQLEAIRVKSRISTLRYRDSDLSVPEIASELNADAIVAGTVFPAGDTVRITVELLDGRTDEHIWSASYDRDVRDVLVLFSEVAGSVADEIEIALTTDEAAQLAAAPIVDPQLYDLYMRGRAAYATMSREGFARAVEHFEEAIRIDSTFAAGWAGLAGTHVLSAYMGGAPPRETFAEAKRASSRAIALDERSSLAHTALGWVRLVELEVDSASVSFQRALDLNPNDVDALHGFGDVLTIGGDLEGGLAYVERARDLDPYSPIWGNAVAAHLYLMRRFEDAVAEVDRIRARWPQARGMGFRTSALWELGRYDDALDYYRARVQDQADVLAAVDAAYSTDGPEAAARVLAEAAAASAAASNPGFGVALSYGRAGDAERTLEWLERARDLHAPDLYQVGVRPELAFLHADPRFQAFVADLGLAIVAMP